MNNVQIWRRFDYVLFGVTLVLVLIGIAMVRSTTLGAVDPQLVTRLPDQIRFAFIGLAALIGLALLDYRTLGGLHWWLYLLSVGLLALVPFFGVEGDGGNRSWLNLGISVQPSELAKFFVTITLAHFLSVHYERLGNPVTILQTLIHIGIPALLVFIQPDLGMTIVYVVIWAVLVWGAGLKLQYIGAMLGLAVLVAPIVWSQMAQYQRDRITTFIVPESDPDGYYNIRQALITIGNGGLAGQGYANGTQGQLRFLRVRHTDFIFSQIAEEFGFIGGVVVIVLIGIVILRILRGARTAADPLGALICYGVAGVIFFQTVVSIGMNLNLLPVTGLTLPFISSGGTSLLSVMASIGLAESVIMRRRRLE